MNPFQAAEADQIIRARASSAVRYGPILLDIVIAELVSQLGPDVADRLRSKATGMMDSAPERGSHDGMIDGFMIQELAIEQLDRSLQLALKGESTLRGWTLEGTEPIEQRKGSPSSI